MEDTKIVLLPIEKQTKNVSLSIKYIKRSQIIKWVEKYQGRYYTREHNNTEFLIIKDVTYSEFIQLLSEYELYLENGKHLHVINGDVYRFNPHEDVLLTDK